MPKIKGSNHEEHEEKITNRAVRKRETMPKLEKQKSGVRSCCH